jgi:VCBS repeat-containing protein
VTVANVAPVAAGEAYTITEDTQLVVSIPGVLGNDTDVNGDELTAVVETSTPNGTLVLNPNGSFTYTPDSNFFGTDMFTYHASDGTLPSNAATVTITVTPLSDNPVAASDVYSVDEDAVLTITAPGVLANDTDPDGGTLTAVLVTDVSSGTLALSANGSFTYTPDADFFGTDTFTYYASSGTLASEIVTVTITVDPVNDVPVAVGDTYSMNEDTILTVAAPGVLANDTDIDTNTLTAVLVANVSSGTLVLNADGSFTYTPDMNFFGTVTFTYVANDGLSNSNVVTVTITVTDMSDLLFIYLPIMRK